MSGIVDNNSPSFTGERTLPYEGSLHVTGSVFDATIEAANQEAAEDIIEALVGSEITVMGAEEDDCWSSGQDDGWEAWGRIIGRIPMGVLHGGVREAMCSVMKGVGR